MDNAVERLRCDGDNPPEDPEVCFGVSQQEERNQEGSEKGKVTSSFVGITRVAVWRGMLNYECIAKLKRSRSCILSHIPGGSV